ncbi:hypothetical protein HF325_003580 [Metschnikowia pulcherrima]|uniref:Uncharacterized protein n=1 Tax=Metschnikowia pulcherrima TaxID=27326 RepID=A0A8H7GRX8_9ASCO|nr:hypothetical protein HF325_003580 [Metschnikowia pulcherrima]
MVIEKKTATIHSQESAEEVAGHHESNFVSPTPESSRLGGGGTKISKNIDNSSEKLPISGTFKAKLAVGIFRQFKFGPGERNASTNKTPEDIRRSDLKFIQTEFKSQKWGENANFKTIRAKRLIEKKSKNANFFDILNGLPEGDHSVKFDLKNQFDIPVSNIEDALDAHFMQAKIEYLEEYNKIASSWGWIAGQKDLSEVEIENSSDLLFISESERYHIARIESNGGRHLSSGLHLFG